ncbi:putative methyltransferase PMT26 [Acipenser oxyrinchus oxyrinchus]|uniref:Methyltransferase PMT26 n=1 Tax=Acipenser oxyrinchus oxyrinchus TaxID=40147 RepID=A0AAD8DDL0_ACIOX|nr:putative methyltransferase PMT26 [Acipenser oxyrinchus oxyrinchus]
MKTLLLLTSLLAVALVSQAAEVKLTLDDSLGKALLDLASGGQQKREEEGDDNQHASLDVSDTNEKREMDESDFLGESDELDGLVDDLQQKREMGFADDADESQGEKRELAGSENKGLQGKAMHGSRSVTCYHSKTCHHYHYRHCTHHPSPRCSKHVHLRCLIVKRHCVRRRKCHYHHYYRHGSCLRCTSYHLWKNM